MVKQCPKCDAEKVTLTPDEGTILGHPIEYFVLSSDGGDSLGIEVRCWSCGWTEQKRLTVEEKT